MCSLCLVSHTTDAHCMTDGHSRDPQGRRRYADALVQRLRGQCSTVICSLVRMFLCKVHVQRRREQFNAAARVIQRGYQQSCARARWSIAYVDLLATEFERLVKAGYDVDKGLHVASVFGGIALTCLMGGALQLLA